MTKDEIFEKVKDIISDKLAYDRDKIKLESSFINDLKADSMDILDLVDGFDEEFNITIPEESGRTFETVGDVVDFLATVVK
ncbi:MAG: acyl carrier protein [Sphaerochaetaceae bacterium]|jgi:acyl carrier protein|nr:acyl carrier protein [Sphaerochaetaceae bacterium]MDD3163498.1 acyl carrier protein [Sphaerochaetaceae bacterium]MDD4007817.1 acyl carrier protein [Sphaerochaetaceae bacterium]MDD4397320.1 acyl carrier protein [Sphaerochaetaceae bacterium]